MTEGTDTFEDHCWKDLIPPDVLEVYRPYRRQTQVRGQVAVLAVDLFAGVFPDEPLEILDAIKENPRSCGRFAWAARPVITRLLEYARAKGMPVVYSSADLGRSTVDADRATNRPSAADDAGHVAIHPHFLPAPDELVILKRRASVFFETGLLAFLRTRSIDTLVLCSESTSGCVRATAVDAYSHGFHVVVVEDAVFDRSELSHKISLFDMHHKYADVMTLAEFEDKLN